MGNKKLIVYMYFFILVIGIFHKSNGFLFSTNLPKYLFNPGILKVNNKFIAITDLKTNKIFIFTHSGTFINSIGSKGEGPGELQTIECYQFFINTREKLTKKTSFSTDPNLVGRNGGIMGWGRRPLFDNEIIVSDLFKIVYYSVDGKVIKEVKKTNMASRLMKTQNNWVGYELTGTHTLYSSIYLYSTDFKTKKELAKFKLPSPFMNKIELVDHCIKFEIAADDDLIVLSNTQKGFYFAIYNTSGELINHIQNIDYSKIIIDEDWKRDKLSQVKSNPIINQNWAELKNKFYFPKYFPPFENFCVSHDGRILIRTYKKMNGNTLYLLTNKKGEVKKEIYLPSDIENSEHKLHFALFKESIYYIVYNAKGEGEYELRKQITKNE